MHVSALVNQVLHDVDEGLDNDLVEEFLRHLHLLLLADGLVVGVVVRLVCQLIEEICVSQLVHSTVVSMNEGLLIDLILDVG
jgi:hypothetical protein